MRADARANRQALIDAATRQIAAHGPDVPFSTIAEDAGVGIATLYRNFPTRQELVLAVLEALRERVTELVEDAQALMGVDAERGWTAFAHGLADLQPGALVSTFSEELVGDHHLSPHLQAQRTEFINSVESVVQEAIRAEVVRPDLTAQQFQMGLASVTRPLPRADVPTGAEHHDWLVEVYLHGLRP